MAFDPKQVNEAITNFNARAQQLHQQAHQRATEDSHVGDQFQQLWNNVLSPTFQLLERAMTSPYHTVKSDRPAFQLRRQGMDYSASLTITPTDSPTQYAKTPLPLVFRIIAKRADCKVIPEASVGEKLDETLAGIALNAQDVSQAVVEEWITQALAFWTATA